MRADVIESLLHGGDFLGVLVGNLVLDLFFERHDELDRVQGIRTKVVDERRFVLDFGLVHAQLLGDDLLDSLLYVFHASPPLAGCERSKAADFTRTGAFAQNRGLSPLIAPPRKTRFPSATAYTYRRLRAVARRGYTPPRGRRETRQRARRPEETQDVPAGFARSISHAARCPVSVSCRCR